MYDNVSNFKEIDLDAQGKLKAKKIRKYQQQKNEI
jgi:hypothetical protein